MENKHFSHHHPLTFYHLPQPSHHHCSACKSPASDDIYVCWQCNYFLHNQCFRATRSLKHPSHPLHPLTLVPFPTYPSSSFFCNSCHLAGDAFSYTCSACEFDLHLHCALTHTPNPNSNPNPLYAPPNPNPQQPSFPIPHNPIYPPPNPTFNPNPLYPPPNPNLQQPSSPTSHNQIYPPPNPNSDPISNPSPPTRYNHIYPPPNPNSDPISNPTPNLNPPPPFGYPTPQNNLPPQNPTAANPPPPPESIIKHFSHPHELTQTEIEKTKPKICSACECELVGAAYICTELYCTFNLHKACFDSPRELKHPSHHHHLTLVAAPPYSNGSFTCDACQKSGKAFAYTCAACSYDLHIDCVRWTEGLIRPDHDHVLSLFYKSTLAGGKVFVCSVCCEAAAADEKGWVYYCRECGFGTHLDCVKYEVKKQDDAAGSDAGGGVGDQLARFEDELCRFQLEKMNLDFQVHMVKQQADFIASIANSWN